MTTKTNKFFISDRPYVVVLYLSRKASVSRFRHVREERGCMADNVCIYIQDWKIWRSTL